MRLGWLGLAVGLLGCSSHSPSRSPAASPNLPAERLVQLPGAPAQLYSTDVTPGPARGERESSQVEAALHDVAKARALKLTGDGRLAQLATFVGEHFDASGAPPLSSAVDAYARRLGLIEPVPLYMIFGAAADGGWAEPMRSMLAGTPRTTAFNRYGVAVVERNRQPIAIVVLSASAVELAPMARHVRPGDAVHLRGRMRPPFQKPHVEVTLPDGSVTNAGEQAGSVFKFDVPVTAPGTHRIELLGEGPYGAEVLANFPVFAGNEEPALVAVTSGAHAPEPSDTIQVAARLLTLLNEARKVAGAPALAVHPGLAKVAEAHSADMVTSGFFGHVSPTEGGPSVRVRRADLGFVLLAENIGRGSTAEEVHTMLLDSPGHRANALDPNLSQVGIGVVIDRRDGHAQIVATEEFGGVSPPIDLARAPNQVVELINARRAAGGLAKLETDATLAAAAHHGANAFFAEPTRTQQQVVESVNDELAHPAGHPSPIARRMRAAQSFLVVIVSLERAAQMSEALDPGARYVGVGAARGSRPETGPESAAVVVVLGWPR